MRPQPGIGFLTLVEKEFTSRWSRSSRYKECKSKYTLTEGVQAAPEMGSPVGVKLDGLKAGV